jgi:large subunit ribosomal protein L29
MKKTSEFRDLSIDELEANVIDARKQLFKLANERQVTKQFEKPHRIPNIKKQIAQMLTIIDEKKQLANS